MRFLVEVDAGDESMQRIVKKIPARSARAHFSYEAGLTGHGLHRLIIPVGYECTVVARSLILKKPGDWIKTNLRDALCLARLLRAGS